MNAAIWAWSGGLAVAAGLLAGDPAGEAPSVHSFTVQDIDGKDVSLSAYKGQVLMIVNVASECGYTDRTYAGLEALQQKYRDRGLRVLAFPANNFGGQEPGSNTQIKEFCRNVKKATFDLFAKVSVKGDDICPLFKYLSSHPDPQIGGELKWNFEKFVVDREGKVRARFGTKTLPEDPAVISKLEELLGQEAEKP